MDAALIQSPQSTQNGSTEFKDGLNSSRRGLPFRKFYAKYQIPDHNANLGSGYLTQRSNSEFKSVESFKNFKPVTLMSTMKNQGIESDAVARYYNSKNTSFH